MSARDDFEEARDPLSDLPKDEEWGDREEERREAACPWREALEQEAGSDESVDLLKAIRDELVKGKHGGGAWPTPMGALVVGAKETLEVLASENPYSVREYWKRMKDVHMPMHLGLDAAPRHGPVCPIRGRDKDWAEKYPNEIGSGEYERDSIANEYIYRIGRAEAFCRALRETRREFQDAEKETLQDAMKSLALPGGGGPRPELRVTIDLWAFTERVIAELSRQWFAIPDGKYIRLGGEPKKPEDETAYCPSDFVLFSRHVFRPDPDDHVEKQAAVRGEKVMTAARAAIGKRFEHPGAAHPFLEHLTNKDPDIVAVARRAVGAIDGFVAANWGSFLCVARTWLKEDLWRIQRKHREDLDDLKAKALKFADLLDEKEAFPWDSERVKERLEELEELLEDARPFLAEVIEVLKSNPVPAWLHRFAVAEVKLNGTPIRAGERVIVHLGRAATDKNDPHEAADILFGGPYDPRFPRKYLHACPGKELAMGVLTGMLVGLLEQKDVRRESTLTMSFSPRGIGAPALPPMPLAPPKPDDPRRLSIEDHRLWIAMFGLLLPVLSYLVAGIFPGERFDVRWYPLRDVSEYFHTSAVSVFCGMLIAMSGFLGTYRGYDVRDELPTNVAGWSAALVAGFPTIKSWAGKDENHWWPWWFPVVHVTAAFVMFVCLIDLAVRLFRKSEDEKKKSHPRHERPIEKKFRDDLCLIAGLIMTAALVWIGVAFGLDDENLTPSPSFRSFLRELILKLAFVRGRAGAWTALGLMLSCVLISIGWFRRSLRKERDEAKTPLQHEWVAFPLVVIAAIAGGMGCILAYEWLSEVTGKVKLDTLIMLVPEVLAIWAFAISWIVKSQHPRVNPWVDRFRRLVALVGWRYELPRL
jgi:hypothetical protein